jgi:hypothetical protein
MTRQSTRKYLLPRHCKFNGGYFKQHKHEKSRTSKKRDLDKTVCFSLPSVRSAREPSVFKRLIDDSSPWFSSQWAIFASTLAGFTRLQPETPSRLGDAAEPIYPAGMSRVKNPENHARHVSSQMSRVAIDSNWHGSNFHG